MNFGNRPQSTDEWAAYWFLRLQDEHVSPEEIEAALDWEAEDPAHAKAMDRVASFWRQSDDFPTPKLPERVFMGAPERRARTDALDSRSRWGRRLALVASLFILVFGASFFAWQRHDLDSATVTTYATPIGENRSYLLSDGSTMTLSAASSASVSYSRKQREVTLTSGEALFQVAKDVSRPFAVSALGGRVRAVGTAFNVHRGENQVVVTVVSGVVRVEPHNPTGLSAEVLPATTLGKGYQLSYFQGGGTSSIRQVSTDFVTAWQSGKLFFFDRSLDEIVFDLNRYSSKRIVIDSEQAKSLKFTGMVAAERIDEWLNGLQRTTQIRLVEENDRLILTRDFPH